MTRPATVPPTLREVVTEALGRPQLDAAQTVLARVIATTGFGGRRDGEVMLVTAGSGAEGSLAGGAADAAVIAAADQLLSGSAPSTSVDVPVGDREAVEAGLACGGTLTVLLQRLSSLDGAAQRMLRDGLDLVLVTDVATGSTGAVVLERTGELDESDPLAELSRAARRMLEKGPLVAATVRAAERDWYLDPVVATPTLLVLGRAALADALVAAGGLIGWNVMVQGDARDGSGLAERDAAVAAADRLRAGDGVVVLSHDIELSGTVLAHALRGRCGYVGALGSRHTQQARSAWLRDHGIDPIAIRTIRGPVGLDLGSRTPEETALAIVAEMLGVLRGRTAVPLSRG